MRPILNPTHTILNTTRTSQPHTHRKPHSTHPYDYTSHPNLSIVTRTRVTLERHTTHHASRNPTERLHHVLAVIARNTGGLDRLDTTTFVPGFRTDHSILVPALGEFAPVSRASTFEHDDQVPLEKIATGTERLNCRFAELMRTKKNQNCFVRNPSLLSHVSRLTVQMVWAPDKQCALEMRTPHKPQYTYKSNSRPKPGSAYWRAMWLMWSVRKRFESGTGTSDSVTFH